MMDEYEQCIYDGINYKERLSVKDSDVHARLIDSYVCYVHVQQVRMSVSMKSW